MMIFLLSFIRFKRGKGLMRLKEGELCWLAGLLAPVVLLGMTSICLAQGNTWTTKEVMPTPSCNHGTSVVNGKIYAIGGETAGGGCTSPVSSQKVEVYDPATNSWTTKVPMPTARASLSTSAANGKIYAIGGDFIQCSVDVPTVEEYDPQTDIWLTKTGMGAARTGLSSSVVNGKIYVIGGWSQHLPPEIVLADVEEYDLMTGTWLQKTPMHDGRAWFSTCVVDGKIYAFGGRGANNVKLKTVEVYDPATDIWTRKNDMPHELGNYFVSSVNGLIYIFGGTWTNGGVPRSESWEYNPVSDTWSSMTPMPTARSAGHASAVDGKIYVIGGSSTDWPFTPTSTVFEYTPPAVVGVEDPSWGENNPTKSVLHQNYPNPFNPETLIRFALPKASHVKLEIYSVMGELITTLIDETRQAGYYSEQFDASGLASGVFFYRLQAADFVDTKKLLLLR